LERKKSEPIPTVIPAANASQTTTPTGSSQDLTTSGGGGTSRSDRLARKRSKSRSTQGDFRIQLTLEQKLDIIILEYDQIKNGKTRQEAANEKKIDQLEVCLDSLLLLISLSAFFLLLSLMLNGLIPKQWILN